jgi:hypothetical protein
MTAMCSRVVSPRRADLHVAARVSEVAPASRKIRADSCRHGLSPAEATFIAESTLVYIQPRQAMPNLDLIEVHGKGSTNVLKYL